MGFVRKIFFVLAVGLTASANAQQLSVVKDLRPEALKFDGREYVRAEPNENLKIFYFNIKSSEYGGEYLQINASQNFSLFINGQLAELNQRENVYSFDSLRHRFGSPELLVGIHQDRPSNDLLINICSVSKVSQPAYELKRGSSFRDFTVIAILILMMLFISLIRLNPKLTSDYFSLTKIFSLRETDDSQIYSRITSSSNILFYVFCSLMAGFSLTLIFEFTSISNVGLRAGNFWMSFFQWIKISMVILSFFFLKILLVYSLSMLFGIKGVGGVHFFYWIRVLLIVASLVTGSLFLYFITRGQSITVYQTVLWIITLVLTFIIVLVFLKLMRKAECSIFHLFSYICATEIIPFLITIKLLHQ